MKGTHLIVACAIALSGALISGASRAQQYFDSKKYGQYYEEEKVWVEAETVLPDFPKPENLIEVYVSAATTNRFFVDAKSVNPGSDGVVRFTLVVESPAGARNLTYEGIRCETRQRRVYGIGRGDGSWARARSAQWVAISGSAANRQHAALSRDYFCPGGVVIRTQAEGERALRQGGHPDAVKGG